jgi:hypothetical protein
MCFVINLDLAWAMTKRLGFINTIEVRAPRFAGGGLLLSLLCKEFLMATLKNLQLLEGGFKDQVQHGLMSYAF